MRGSAEATKRQRDSVVASGIFGRWDDAGGLQQEAGEHVARQLQRQHQASQQLRAASNRRQIESARSGARSSGRTAQATAVAGVRDQIAGARVGDSEAFGVADRAQMRRCELPSYEDGPEGEVDMDGEEAARPDTPRAVEEDWDADDQRAEEEEVDWTNHRVLDISMAKSKRDGTKATNVLCLLVEDGGPLPPWLEKPKSSWETLQTVSSAPLCMRQPSPTDGASRACAHR